MSSFFSSLHLGFDLERVDSSLIMPMGLSCYSGLSAYTTMPMAKKLYDVPASSIRRIKSKAAAKTRGPSRALGQESPSDHDRMNDTSPTKEPLSDTQKMDIWIYQNYKYLLGALSSADTASRGLLDESTMYGVLTASACPCTAGLYTHARATFCSLAFQWLITLINCQFWTSCCPLGARVSSTMPSGWLHTNRRDSGRTTSDAPAPSWPTRCRQKLRPFRASSQNGQMIQRLSGGV